jgi:hypothetical protein
MTMNGNVIPVSSAIYDPTNLTVALIPSSLLSLHTLAKKLAIATNKLAVAEQRTAARLARANGPSASAVDALSAVAELTAKPKSGQNHA